MTASSILRSLLPPRSAVWLVVGLVAGFAGGTFVALRWLAPAQGWLASVGQSFMMTQMASGQYAEADYPAAKSALEDFLSYLDSVEPAEEAWKPGQEPWLDARGLAFDKALTAGRLALLEERENHADAAAAYWGRAEAYARTAGWRDSSRENIRRFLARVDDGAGAETAPDAGGTVGEGTAGEAADAETGAS